MTNFFPKIIDNIYNIIAQPIDNEYKKQSIKYYKKKLHIEMNESFGSAYYKFVYKDKNNGVVFTPYEISEYIIKNTINKDDILKNPFVKIIDPSCGCGNIIIPCFLYLREIYSNNFELINSRFNLNLNLSNVDKHILNNNIYGYDINEFFLKILFVDLFNITGYINTSNFECRDFLTAEIDDKFDIFIGNPPYVGKKNIDKEYSRKLKKLYKDIYKDKSDIAYCFFQKSLLDMNLYGKLGFITSRYFIESPSGKELRKILKELCNMYKIVDFYGIRPFKNAGIDPVIIFLNYDKKSDYDIEIIKPLPKIKNKFFFENANQYKRFYLNKSILDNERWIIRDEEERNIVNKIENKCFTNLSNICDSYQGIITGCDKAFIVSQKDIAEDKIEKDLIKPWIKNSYINSNRIENHDKYIIYSNFITDSKKYPNAINHIIKFKDKLKKRRECINGTRKWYELQWGRDYNIFENKKIIFPYKSNKNKFAMDNGDYFSADVYCLVLKKNVPFTYEFLLFLLNSKIYEFYFKTYAKKLGEDIYEYYPNNIMKLSIPVFTQFNNNEDELYNFFKLNEKEIKIIKNS